VEVIVQIVVPIAVVRNAVLMDVAAVVVHVLTIMIVLTVNV
jgi:hypothetical protein